jgi:hypothetical protein
MLKHFLMFVLVILVIKTNAQSPFYYYDGSTITLTESNDRLLIKIPSPINSTDEASLLTKINTDPDFELESTGTSNYLILKRKTGSISSKSTVINYYINEPYIFSASFIFEWPNGAFQGTSDEIVVKSKGNLNYTELNDLFSNYGDVNVETSEMFENTYHLFYEKGTSLSILEIANAIFETDEFEYATPNFFRTYQPNGLTSASCSSPGLNDPDFNNQWGLYNNGITGTNWSDINICNAWNYNKGYALYNGVSLPYYIAISIIDDGIDTRHPEYSGNYYQQYSFDVVSPGNFVCTTGACVPVYTDPGCANSVSKHGTWSAGVMVANQNNSIGISGVAPEIKLISGRIGYFDAGLNQYVTADGWIQGGIYWGSMNSTVVCCPWTINGGPSKIIDNAINDVTSVWPLGAGPYRSSGTPLIFAAGNYNNSTIAYPANNPNVIAVGAMSMCHERKRSSSNPALVDPGVTPDPNGPSCDMIDNWGSNYGPTSGSFTNGYLSVVAPGVNIHTTDPDWNNSYISDYQGTSAAASFVAGVAGLIRATNECLTATEIKDLIEKTSDKVGSYSYGFSKTNGAWDPEMGFGKVNAGNAVAWAHDMYRQAEVEIGARVYASNHKIFSGADVDITNIKAQSNYTLSSTANVVFYAPEEIILKPGFEASAGSSFVAKISSSPPCTNAYFHYKQTNHLNDRNPETPRAMSFQSNITHINLFPNPTNSVINISFHLKYSTAISYIISNIYGQEIMQKVKEGNFGTNLESISVENLSAGVYIFTLKTQYGEKQLRFIKTD